LSVTMGTAIVDVPHSKSRHVLIESKAGMDPSRRDLGDFYR